MNPLDALQRNLIYFPDPGDPGSVARRVPGSRDVRLRTADGLELRAWWLAPGGVERHTAVLYCPGNGGNRLGRLGVGRELAARGFGVLLLDYRGYGANPGSPSEAGLVRDARAGAAYLRDIGFAAMRTLYVGESLGTGVVAQLVASDPPAGAVLRSPFTSLVDVGKVHYPFLPVDLVLRDRFDSVEPLRASRVPVHVLRGEADEVIPTAISARLAAQVGRLHGETVLPGVGHNDEVWFGPLFADVVARLADDVIAS